MKIKLKGFYGNFLLVLFVALAYFVFAKLGLLFPVVKEQVTLIWAPSGIALASMLLFGYKMLPGIVLGAFLNNITTDASWEFAAFTAIGNPGEAVIAYYLLKKFNFNIRIEKIEDVLMLYFFTILACMAAPTFGVFGLVFSETISSDVYLNVWWKWWLGDTMGIIVVTPAILTAYSYFPWIKFEKRYIIEIVSYLLLLFLASIIVFSGLLPRAISPPLTFILFPFIIYVALRFGQPFTSFTIIFISIMATLLHEGPFIFVSSSESVLLIYVFMSIASLTGMILAATNTELKQSNEELQKVVHIASHNLKSPVNNIIALASLYDKDAAGSDFNLELIKKIETSTSNLAEEMDDLIMIITNKQNIRAQTKDIDVQKALQKIKQSIESQIKETQTQFSEDFSELKIIKYPPSNIDSILLNLITNSIKYRSLEKPLIITIKLFYENNYVCLSVKDTGSGIDLEKHGKNLFGLYKRFHADSTGKGLGLYMVKKQVESLGGKIKVKSEVGVGTEFKIYLYRAN